MMTVILADLLEHLASSMKFHSSNLILITTARNVGGGKSCPRVVFKSLEFKIRCLKVAICHSALPGL